MRHLRRPEAPRDGDGAHRDNRPSLPLLIDDLLALRLRRDEPQLEVPGLSHRPELPRAGLHRAAVQQARRAVARCERDGRRGRLPAVVGCERDAAADEPRLAPPDVQRRRRRRRRGGGGGGRRRWRPNPGLRPNPGRETTQTRPRTRRWRARRWAQWRAQRRARRPAWRRRRRGAGRGGGGRPTPTCASSAARKATSRDDDAGVVPLLLRRPLLATDEDGDAWYCPDCNPTSAEPSASASTSSAAVDASCSIAERAAARRPLPPAILARLGGPRTSAAAPARTRRRTRRPTRLTCRDLGGNRRRRRAALVPLPLARGGRLADRGRATAQRRARADDRRPSLRRDRTDRRARCTRTDRRPTPWVAYARAPSRTRRHTRRRTRFPNRRPTRRPTRRRTYVPRPLGGNRRRRRALSCRYRSLAAADSPTGVAQRRNGAPRDDDRRPSLRRDRTDRARVVRGRDVPPALWVTVAGARHAGPSRAAAAPAAAASEVEEARTPKSRPKCGSLPASDTHTSSNQHSLKRLTSSPNTTGSCARTARLRAPTPAGRDRRPTPRRG